MPIPIPNQADTTPPVFPSLTREQIDAARTPSWYDTFEDITIPSTIIDLDELGEKEAFLDVSAVLCRSQRHQAAWLDCTSATIFRAFQIRCVWI